MLDYLVTCVACVLGQLCEHNASQDAAPVALPSIFDCHPAPRINILDYCRRLYNYAKCSPGTFVCALIYIDRVITNCPAIIITKHTVHRLLGVAIVCAIKFWDDVYYSNKYYAKVCGVQPKELSWFELNFLFSLEFDLHITPQVFSQYFEYLSAHIADNTCGHHMDMGAKDVVPLCSVLEIEPESAKESAPQLLAQPQPLAVSDDERSTGCTTSTASMSSAPSGCSDDMVPLTSITSMTTTATVADFTSTWTVETANVNATAAGGTASNMAFLPTPTSTGSPISGNSTGKRSCSNGSYDSSGGDSTNKTKRLDLDCEIVGPGSKRYRSGDQDRQNTFCPEALDACDGVC